MKIEDLKEDFSFWDFINLDKQELDVLPYSVFKWNCCCRDCENGTTVRDYGFEPHYFLNRNSKRSVLRTRDYWNNLSIRIWFCGKHNEYYKRLGWNTMIEKYVDLEKPKLGNFVKKVNQGNEKIQ